jgi:hypothetical protein
MSQPLLLAIDPQTIEAVIGLVAILFWVLGKLLGQPQQPPARRPQAQLPPRPLERPPQQGQADPLQSEIEEFLRRASGQRKPADTAAQGRPDRTRLPRSRQPGARQDPRRGRPGQPTAPQGSPQPVAAAPDPALDTPEALDRHVKQFMDTGEFDRRTAKLTTIEKQDQQFEKHLKDTFTHEVGHLRGGALAISGESSVTSAAPPIAEGQRRNFLALLLANPAELKTAVLLNEILPRPEHRW